MFKSIAVAALILAASCTAVLGQTSKYAQCGGFKFEGQPGVCPEAHTCTWINEHVSLCLPSPSSS